MSEKSELVKITRGTAIGTAINYSKKYEGSSLSWCRETLYEVASCGFVGNTTRGVRGQRGTAVVTVMPLNNLSRRFEVQRYTAC